MSDGWQNNLYVKTSPIHGLGVFARRTFATGETILVREERPVTPDQPLDAERGELEHHCDRLDGGRQVYLGFPERHINHSCDANSFTRRIEGVPYQIALRPIRAGEEITKHYGVDLRDGQPWPCNCGSSRCLGTLPGDFFSLPLPLQIELQPLLSDWFKLEQAQPYATLMAEAGLDQPAR